MLKNDLHVHTIASGHAFNTVSEIFEYASKNSMVIVATTDHGPNMEHSAHLGYFETLTRLPKLVNGVIFLKSCEANILDVDGNIDIPLNIQDKLDFLMAGIHDRTSYSKTENSVDNNTMAIINAIKKNHIKIISHPHRPEFPIDINKIVKFCADSNVALEINLSTLITNQSNANFINEIKYLIQESVEFCTKLTVSSDTHYISELGDNSILDKLNINVPDIIWLKTKEQIFDFIKS